MLFVFSKDVRLPVQLQRAMAAEAEAAREARAKVNMMTSSNGTIFRVTGPLCGEFTGPGEFPAQKPVMRSIDVFFDLRLNKRLNKQPWGWWFQTPPRSLWRQCKEWEENPEVSLPYSWPSVLRSQDTDLILRKIPYRKISQSLGARSGAKILALLWNVVVASTAVLPVKFQSNWGTLITDLTHTRLCEMLR